MVRLFHFSEESDIGVFVPRPVKIPAARALGRDWLNGPLVWAIDEWHQPMYLFPRDCPRILLWPSASTTSEDRRAYWTTPSCRMIAFVEWEWFDRLSQAVLYRYALPGERFQSLNDAGMWVSQTATRPIEVQKIANLPKALEDSDVELRVLPTLESLKVLWSTSLHVSGIRLRNARTKPLRLG